MEITMKDRGIELLIDHLYTLTTFVEFEDFERYILEVFRRITDASGVDSPSDIYLDHLAEVVWCRHDLEKYKKLAEGKK